MKLLFLLCFLFASCAQLPSKRTDKLSIIQGVTNSKEVEFSIVAKKGRELRFELRSAEGEIIAPDEANIVFRDFSPFVVHKVVFVRDQNHDYNLYVFEGTNVIDQRLIGRGQRVSTKLKLAAVSNLNDFFEKDFVLWPLIQQKNPDYLLFLGNNVPVTYASKNSEAATDPEVIWKRYVDHRLTLPVYFQEKLIPIHAIWNDLDFGEKNGNEAFSFKNESKEIFDAFYAQSLTDDDWTKSLGVGGLLTLGDFNLYFLDARSFRSKLKEGSHLGVDQTAWFISKLREDNTPSLVIKGDPFFGLHQNSSFESSQPDDFKTFVEELRKIPTPYVFLSSDERESEIMQFPRSLFGRPSFEITTGPLHGDLEPSLGRMNPWRVVSHKDEVSFTMIENEAKDNHWFMNVENLGLNNEIFYKRELAVYIKDLQDNLKEARKRRHGKRRYRRIRGRRR